MRIHGVIGRKNCGKTHLVARLVRSATAQRWTSHRSR